MHRPFVHLCFDTLSLFLQATAEKVTPKEEEGTISIHLSTYLPYNPNEN